MSTIFTIGEALIDFVPTEKGIPLKHVVRFDKMAGGAPANVACAVARLGGRAAFIGKVGQDAFGDFLVETLQGMGVDTEYVTRTTRASTSLAFVSLGANGSRDFAFYRNPGADMLLDTDEIDPAWFSQGDFLHFGSVGLNVKGAREAHLKAIQAVREKGGIVSFDPNVRLPLWEDAKACRKVIQAFLPLSRILKISDEELSFITGIQEEERALQSLFQGDVEHVLYTRGANGAEWIGRQFRVYVPGIPVSAVDTTGAGDAFMGALLYQLQAREGSLDNLDASAASGMLELANAAAGLTTTRAGAIPALPSLSEVAAGL